MLFREVYERQVNDHISEIILHGADEASASSVGQFQCLQRYFALLQTYFTDGEGSLQDGKGKLQMCNVVRPRDEHACLSLKIRKDHHASDRMVQVPAKAHALGWWSSSLLCPNRHRISSPSCS